MIIESIKNFLENEPLIRQLKLDCQLPTKQKCNKKLLNSIMNNCKNIIYSKNELIYLIKNIDKIFDLNILCKCGNRNTFINNTLGYHKHCCNKCAQLDKLIQEKIRNTKEKRYNNKNFNNRIKAGLTKERKYGDKNYCNRRKIETTCQERYGSKSYLGSKECIIKSKNTKKLLYQDENYHNVEKMNLTKLNTYGHDGLNIIERQTLKMRKTKLIRYGDKNYNNRQKAINTLIKTKGVINVSQISEYKAKIRAKQKEIQEKIYNTKKKNGTHSSSKPEKQIFHLLMCKFPDIKWHYKDKNRYPFNCDFYIPSKDLFIEINFAFEHGDQPFDCNDPQHLKEVEYCNLKKEEINWKGKKKNRYLGKIKTWTIRDPFKYKTAIDNRLNYKVFYNWKEFSNWFNTI